MAPSCSSGKFFARRRGIWRCHKSAKPMRGKNKTLPDGSPAPNAGLSRRSRVFLQAGRGECRVMDRSD
jgi:hypothetical protein